MKMARRSASGLPGKAVELYRKAMKTSRRAMLCLGRCYEMGRGVDADQSMAVYFYRHSAKMVSARRRTRLNASDITNKQKKKLHIMKNHWRQSLQRFPQCQELLLPAPLWLRNTAISPDGATIAFTYRGDIFTVSVGGGGPSKQLSSDPAYDTAPVWSPDGSRIAFASDRMEFYRHIRGSCRRRHAFRAPHNP